MCIIVIKPRGVKINDDFYRSLILSAKRNQDGVGFAFRRSGSNKITMFKGLYTEESFVEYIKKHNIRENDEMIFHARMSTHGEIIPQNCHPFIISANNEILDTIKAENIDVPVFAHNGIFGNFTKDTTKNSDSYNCVKDLISKQWCLDAIKDIGNVKPTKHDLFLQEQLFGLNKIAILWPSGGISMIGNFITDFNGCYFSTGAYKEHKPTLNNYD